MDANFVGIAVTVFLGLVAVGVGVFFGLRAFRKDVTNELCAIREKVVVIGETVKNVWDVIRESRAFGGTGTVERELKNLGTVRITAEPHRDSTTYIVRANKRVFDSSLMEELAKRTGFEEKEKELFGDKLPGVRAPLGTTLIVEVFSSEPSLCAKYMSLLLKWLDSEYVGSVPNVEEFEEPIQV